MNTETKITNEDFLEFTKFESFQSISRTFLETKFENKQFRNKTKSLKVDKNSSNFKDENLSVLYVNLNNELFSIDKNGFPVRVNFYISSQNVAKKYFSQDSIFPENLNKFHIYNCQKVDEIFNQNRKSRDFKITTRNDGFFEYKFRTSDQDEVFYIEENQPLLVCSHCLEIYNKSHNQAFSRNQFILESFFAKPLQVFNFEFEFFDLNQNTQTAENIYQQYWDYIKNKFIHQKNNQCEKCGFVPNSEDENKFLNLHVHKVQNREKLHVLCIGCHAEELNHNYIKRQQLYLEFKS